MREKEAALAEEEAAQKAESDGQGEKEHEKEEGKEEQGEKEGVKGNDKEGKKAQEKARATILALLREKNAKSHQAQHYLQRALAQGSRNRGIKILAREIAGDLMQDQERGIQRSRFAEGEVANEGFEIVPAQDVRMA